MTDPHTRVVYNPLGSHEALLVESQRIAKIGSFELDVATRRLTWSAQQFQNFGFDVVPEIQRELVITRIHPRDRGQNEQLVQRAIAHGEPFTVDYRVVHPDGTVRHLHTIGQPVRDEAGRVVKIVGTSQDVTERKALEHQLQAQYDQLLRLGELKGNFVQAVTHELRSPLTTVLGYAEFLQEHLESPLTPTQRSFLGQIQRGARRIELLLNDLGDFARMEAGTFALRREATSLGERVLDVVEAMRPQAEAARIRLVACLDDDGLAPALDAHRIGQVLVNLIDNAVRFSPAGSLVKVSTFRAGDNIRCEVVDAGPGIQTGDLPRLFQRLSQLEAGAALGDGSGLGLSICKALVEAHGGSIGVRSTPGTGSTFWFEVPL